MPLTHPVELLTPSGSISGRAGDQELGFCVFGSNNFIRDYTTDPPKINHNACANWSAARRSTE
jgi:hypothetical protein